jgi:hypothetical protein
MMGPAAWLGSPRARFYLLLAMLGAGLLPVLGREASWLGSWKMALDWSTFSITTLGPVAAGIACSAYVRFRRSGVPDLLSQAGRPWVGWLAPALGVWALASLAVSLVAAFTTTAAWAVGAHAYPELFWVVPPALVVLGAEVAIGALIGSRIPHYWAAPWAAVIVFTCYILSSVRFLPGVFRTGGVTGSLAGETFAASPICLQALGAIGVAVLAMALSRWDLFLTTSLVHRALAGLVVCAAIPALLLLPGDSDARYVDVAEPRYECRTGEPTVCLLEETTRPLDDLTGRMQRLAGPLVTAGARLPARFAQPAPLARDPSDGVVILDDELSSQVSDGAAAESLVTPAGCPAYYSDSPGAFPERLFTIRRILVRWLLVQDGQGSAPTDGGPADWWALPVEQQYPWIRESYDALCDCRLFDLRLPQ